MSGKKSKGSVALDGNGSGAGNLTVTAQQSRFHTDTEEGNNLKEIVVKDLNISIGNKELLSHAELQLQRGRHYVLHGRNGIGKSTLLRAIASHQIPSIPRGIKVLLLGQTQPELADDMENLGLIDDTVLQHVIRSDRLRERLLYESKQLSVALKGAGDSALVVTCYRQLSHARLEQKVDEARQIAQRRSGARGKDARKVLIQLEEDLKTSQSRLQQEATPTEVNEESQKAAELLVDVQISLEMMNAPGAERKARAVLRGLGFTEQSLEQPRSQLSGGWRTRCSLACALCQSADLLLLDEPTNFLDLPSIIWLEQYIQSLDSSTTVVAVSHDRAFSDAIADELLVLRNRSLERFRGNLSAYEIDRLKTYKHLTRMQEAQDKQKKHIQSTIEGNVQAAKRAGDDKKLKQAASRKKKLDERMGMQVSAKGTRFKLNRDLAGYHLTNRAEIEVPTFDPPAEMRIPTELADLRFPGSLVSFEKVGFGYVVDKKRVPILKEVDLTIHPGDRVGIAGLNGSGKSTLVSLAMGTTSLGKTMAPTSGTVTRHTRARFGLYSQQSVEELETLARERPELTALSHLTEIVGVDAQEKNTRGLLSGLGLVGRTASDVPLSLLSGGQKVRLALAKLLWTPPHLLILDELTTHLDTDTIQALVDALKAYEGAILLVTHDRFFMRCVVRGASMRALAASSRPEEDGDEESDSEDDDEDSSQRTRVVYRLSKGKLLKLDQGMEQYEEIAARSASKLGKA